MKLKKKVVILTESQVKSLMGNLRDLIEVFPEYSIELRGIVNRLKDLMIPFQQKWYYTPEMRGSYSIK